MAILFLIEFGHDDPNITFYICRTCRTHIALGKAFIFNYSVEGVHAGVFAKAVNVYTLNAPAPPRQLVPYTMTDLYCMKCRGHLGWKFVVIPPDDLVITEEMVQLFLPKLRYWNGNSILDAETWEPVPEDD